MNKKTSSDPHSANDAFAGRVYAYETVDEEYEDSGANDEGFYYEWCSFCSCRTEHDLSGCVSC